MAYTALQLAEAFLKAGELHDALDALNQHLSTQPDDHDVLRLRANVLARLPEQAQAALDDLARMPHLTAEDWMLRAQLLERLDDIAGAVAALRAGVTAQPDDERLAERLVYTLHKYGEIPSARQFVAEQLAQQPESWRWLQWAGDLAVEAGEDAAAAIHYTTALTVLEARYPIDTTHPARVMQESVHSEAASLTVLGAYARLRLARAALFMRLGDDAGAEADYAVAMRLIPGDPTIAFNRGLLAARRGDLAQAVGLCQQGWDGATESVRAVLRADLDAPRYADVRARLTL
ncbi:MAG: hypothetical protein OHK0046_14620 [Anaerolineae bacterium]